MSNKRKSEIELHLKNDDKRYSLFTPSSVRSSVWKHFQVIKFLDTVENFARCNHCAEILSYAPRSGTGSLLRHRCMRVRANSSPKSVPGNQNVLSFIQSTLPKKTKEDILKSQLEFIIKDLKPLNTTEGVGFRKFAQALINIGAEYGKQNVEDILVSRSILLNSLVPEEYFHLKSLLEPTLTNSHLAFSTNTWIDERSHRSFFALTSHHITDEFILDSCLLGTRELTEFENETSERLQHFVMDILYEFQLKEKLSQGVIVTDNSAKFVETFRCYKRITCNCHNIILFMKEVLENNNIKEIQELIEASKGLMNFCENSELNNLLAVTMSQKETVKFSSTYNILLSIFTNYYEIEQSLMEKNEWQEIAGINFYLLECVISFFKPFKKCFDIFSTHTIPVVAEYCFWYNKLERCCIPGPRDSEIITELKSAAGRILARVLKPDIMHYVAFFLNPRHKKLSVLSKDELVRTQMAVKQLTNDYQKQRDGDSAMLQSDTNFKDSYTISNTHKDKCSHLNFESDDIESDIDDELKRYLVFETDHDDILQFWKNKVDLPLLRHICRQILNIPACCTKCERSVFSLSDVLEEGKTHISGETIDQLLFLHKNTNCTIIKHENNFMEA